MKWRNVVIVTLIVLPVLVVLGLGFGTDPHEVPSVLVGAQAPDCDLVNLDGAPVKLSALHTKPVVLNFWSTWCVPCVTEHGILQRGAQVQGDAVQFVGVVYQDTVDKARAYLAERGSSYLQVMDAESRCAIDYGVAGVPETFFIAAGGRIHSKEVGPVSAGLLVSTLAEMATP